MSAAHNQQNASRLKSFFSKHKARFYNSVQSAFVIAASSEESIGGVGG